MASRWIRSDGTQAVVTPKDGVSFSLAELQFFVGEYIERVRTRDKRNMYVDEEGTLKGKAPNMIATTLVSPEYRIDPLGIRGDVIVCDPRRRRRILKP